jgi:hypothetical protein
LAILADNFGRSSSALWDQGDFDGNRRVNVFDLALLQMRLGPVVPFDAPLPVPEPGTLWLAVIGLVGCGGMRRWRTRMGSARRRAA